MPDKVSPSRFAAAVKEKYPEYKDYDDLKLTNAVIEKYPEYKDYVDFGVKEAQKPVVSQGFRPSAELPTFQQQVQEAVSRQPEQAQPQPSKYQKAVQDDRSEIAKTLSSLYNGVIGSFETLGKFVAGAPAQFAMQPYQVAPIDIGGTAKSAREFAELPLEKRLEPAREAQKGVEKVADIVRSGYTTREEEKQMAGQFNVFDGEGVLGIGLKDIQGLIAMSGGMATDMALGALTGGTTFVAQGMQYAFDDYDDAVKKSGIKPDANARALYGMAGGIINGLLEKFAVDKLVGDTPVFRDIQRKALANVMKNTASMTGKAAVDAIEEAGVREIKRLTSDLRSKGVRALYRAGVEGGTEAVQAALEDGAKFAANAVQGNQAFNEEEIRKGFLQNVVNSAIAGGVMGPVLGAGADVTFGRNVNTELLKDIAQAKTPEDIQAIQLELTKTFDENNFSQEERDLIMSNVNRYSQIKQTLPQGTDPIAQTIAIPLIERRIKIDNEIQARKANLANLDEALKTDEESEISILEDRRAQINDDIREVVNNEKFNYFDRDGKYFKQLGENAPEEISKNRFDLQQIKTGEYATTESKEPVQEGAPEGGISEYQGTEEGRPQEAPAQADTGYRYIVSEEGAEAPVASLVNKKVRINGKPAILYREGQRIVGRILGTNQILDTFGSVTEMANATPEQFGIEVDDTVVTETPTGYRVEGEEMTNPNENPLDAISIDNNGNVKNVVLTTPAGKRRKFRGQVALDLAYQIQLKEILKNEEEFEAFLEREYQSELDAAQREEAARQVQEPEQAAPTPVDEGVPQPEAAPRSVITTQPTIGRVTAENVERVTDLGTSRIQKKVLNDVKRVFNAIKSIVPATTGAEVTINLHDQESFKNAVLEAGGTEQDSTSRGFYMAPDGSIHLNMDNLASDTMLHEGFHPILDFIEQANPAQIDEFFTQLEAIPEAAGIIAQARQNYEGDTTQKKEAITDFVAGVADGRVVLNPTNFQKIKAFIQNMLNKIGIGQGQVLMNVKNQSDLIKLANFVSEKFVKGEEIKYDNLGDFIEKTPTPSEPIAKSGQLQFQKTIYDESGIVKSPALDKSEFKIAVDEGRISVVNPYVSLKDKFFAITFPDDFFTGEIKFDGETIAYGNGGVFFAARFGKRGDVWAAAGENSANNFVIQANNSLRKNNGEGIIVLSKGDDIKQSTSLEANIAFINTIIKYAEKNGQLDQVVKAIKTTYSIGRAKSADTIIDSFNQFLAGGRGESGQRMVDAKNAFNTMSSALIKEAGPLMTKMLRDMGFDGDTYFNKTKLAKGEYVATTQGLKSMYIDMLQEDFLKGLNNGAVYAALKFNSEIKYEKDPYHPSYPYVMRTVDGSPVKLEVFTKTFNSYGKEGVAIYGQERNKENAFGVATTTKPDFKLDPSFEDNPSQRDLSQKLDEYSALKKPQFQKITEKPTRTEVFLKEQFRYGILGKEIVKFKDQMTGELNAEVKEAERLTKKAQEVIKKYGTALSRADILNFMTGKPTSTPLPTDVSNVLTDMRAHIDTLTERLIQLGVIEDQETIDYYRQNKGEYLVRSYEAINYKDGIMQRLGKGGLNVDNVAKKLNNVDKTVVNTALKFLANRARLIDQIKWSLNDDGTYNVEYYKTGKLQYKTENVKETDLATEIGTGNANEIIDYKKDPQNKVKKGSLTTIEDDIVEGKPVKKMVDTVYNKEMSESDAMKVARKDANDILSDAEAYVSRNSLTGSTNVKSLSKRKEISPEIRALMGEYTDPLYNYYASVFKIANLTSSRQYLNNLRDYGLGKFLFTKEDRPDDATTLIAAEGSETLSPLNGLYTFKPVAESLQEAEKEKTSIALQLIGRVRKFKTVYNPATHVKNVIGNMGFVVSNGHWNYLPESYKYVRALVTGKDDAEIRRVMDTLNRYNVLNNAVGVNELKSYFDRYENVDDFLGKIYDDGRKKSKLSKIAEAAGKVGEAMEKAYAIEDDAFKILAFVNESSRYSKALYNKSYANLNESQKKVIDDRVSEIVKDTYPTFSRVPKFVKNLSKYAFLGNFLSFPAESIRVQYNSLKLALNEYNSGNPKLKTIGLTRMAGFLIYNSLFSSLVYYSYNLAGAGLTGMLGYFGDDDSEEKKKESAIQKFLAAWNKAKDVYISKFSDGKLVYYDIGSLDSYGYQKQVWNSFWSNMNDDKGFYNSISEAVGKGIEPWIELDFTIKNLSALFTNDDGRGGRIYNPEDSFVERVKKTAEFTGKQFGPGALGAMIKIADSYQKGEYDRVMDELVSQVFARKYTVDLKKQFQNYIYVEGTPKMEVGFKNRLSDAEKIYRDAKKQGLKGAELEARYQDAVMAYKEILKTANEYYKAAAAGGVPANALTNIVVNARMGRAASMAIINGYMPDIDMMYIRR